MFVCSEFLQPSLETFPLLSDVAGAISPSPPLPKTFSARVDQNTHYSPPRTAQNRTKVLKNNGFLFMKSSASHGCCHRRLFFSGWHFPLSRKIFFLGGGAIFGFLGPFAQHLLLSTACQLTVVYFLLKRGSGNGEEAARRRRGKKSKWVWAARVVCQ